jgi:hypothetical protein
VQEATEKEACAVGVELCVFAGLKGDGIEAETRAGICKNVAGCDDGGFVVQSRQADEAGTGGAADGGVIEESPEVIGEFVGVHGAVGVAVEPEVAVSICKEGVATDAEGLFVELSAGDREWIAEQEHTAVEVAVADEVGDLGPGGAS